MQTKQHTHLAHELTQFTGTEGYTRWSPLFRNFVLTDGTLYLAENAGAFWLMDAIASYYSNFKTEHFVIASLEKEGKGWVLRLVDDVPASKTFARQVIEYSDFPLDSIKLYVIRQDDLFVILLPSEY